MSHFKRALLIFVLVSNLSQTVFAKHQYLYSNVSSVVDIITNDYTHRLVDTYRKEPRFLSFTTSDDAIEIDIDFNVPFISVPVKRSLGGAKSFMQNVMRGSPLVNVNVASILVAGLLTVAGVFVSALFKNYQSNAPISGFQFKKGRAEDQVWNILDFIETSLSNYDIDATTCTQKIICFYVKNAMINVNNGEASSIEDILNGVTSATWAMKYVKGTAIESAIKVGRRGNSCEETYSTCKLNAQHISRILKKIKTKK